MRVTKVSYLNHDDIYMSVNGTSYPFCVCQVTSRFFVLNIVYKIVFNMYVYIYIELEVYHSYVLVRIVGVLGTHPASSRVVLMFANHLVTLASNTKLDRRLRSQK